MARELVIVWAGRHHRSGWEEICTDYRRRIVRWVPVRDVPVRARAAADELAAMAEQSPARYLHALAAHATGAVRLASGDELLVVRTSEGILLTPYDPDFADGMAAFDRGRKKYRNALRELAR